MRCSTSLLWAGIVLAGRLETGRMHRIIPGPWFPANGTRAHRKSGDPSYTVRRLNSVACGLPVRFGMHRSKVGARVIAILGNTALQRFQAIVFKFAVQFV